MQINKIKRKITILELFDKAKRVERKRNLIALAEKNVLLNNLTVESENIGCEINEIEKSMAENLADPSFFNFHQKYHYLLALDARSNGLSQAVAVNQREKLELENKIKLNSSQKNKIFEKIDLHYRVLSEELEKKYLDDIR